MVGVAVAVGLVAGNDCLFAAEKPAMPNIIVIMADDVGYGDVSC
jgi:HAMP domain-containing protein